MMKHALDTDGRAACRAIGGSTAPDNEVDCDTCRRMINGFGWVPGMDSEIQVRYTIVTLSVPWTSLEDPPEQWDWQDLIDAPDEVRVLSWQVPDA